MNPYNIRESELDPSGAIVNDIILAGDPWRYDLTIGQVLRIVDTHGLEGTDCIFFNRDDPADHYSAIATINDQGNIYLTCGTVLRSETHKPLLEIIADTCGHHDTLGGCCSSQSNTVRYAREKRYMHNCRDNFMLEISRDASAALLKRDLAPNINWFTNVPVTEDGNLEFADGFSKAGAYVEMRALANVTVMISNCPQLNNPCCGYNPTDIRALVWDAPSDE